LAVIIDNKPNEDVTSVIMSDDSTGMGIPIPAMLISFADGEKIVNFLETASDEEKKQAALSAEFVMNNPDNRVEYAVWYSSIDDRARDFLAYFWEFQDKLGIKAEMSPHFVSWPCPSCDEEFKLSECVSSGRYCASPHKYVAGVAVKGRDIILEDLREKCIYENQKKVDV